MVQSLLSLSSHYRATVRCRGHGDCVPPPGTNACTRAKGLWRLLVPCRATCTSSKVKIPTEAGMAWPTTGTHSACSLQEKAREDGRAR